MSPVYVYGCPKCGTRGVVIHKMDAPIVVACGGDDCGEWMHRIPQLFDFGRNPWDVLKVKLRDGYRDFRIRDQKKQRSKHGKTKLRRPTKSST